jgi:hypothetical protein
MRQTNHARRPLYAEELMAWYMRTFILAMVAAVVGAASFVAILRQAHAGCHKAAGDVVPGGTQWVCPDGVGYAIPGLFGGVAMVVGVVTLMAILIGRRTDADTIERISKHALWLVFVAVLIPCGVLLPLLLASPGSGNPAYGLLGLIPTAFAALPLLVARYRPDALPRVLAFCLLVPVAALILWEQLILLLPLATIFAGGWAIALGMSLWASRLKRPAPSAQVTHH